MIPTETAEFFATDERRTLIGAEQQSLCACLHLN